VLGSVRPAGSRTSSGSWLLAAGVKGLPDIDFLFDADCPSHEQALAWQRQVRVLVAAEAVFTRHGASVPTDDVALAAGVDIGTILHDFPTKEALVEAVLVARLERLKSEAEDLAGDDAGAAFHDFCASVVEGSRTKLPLVDVLNSAALHGSPVGRALAAALDPLLRRAQAAGDVRADVDVTEVIVLLVGCSRAVQYAVGDSHAGLRILAILLDGLRPQR